MKRIKSMLTNLNSNIIVTLIAFNSGKREAVGRKGVYYYFKLRIVFLLAWKSVHKVYYVAPSFMFLHAWEDGVNGGVLR